MRLGQTGGSVQDLSYRLSINVTDVSYLELIYPCLSLLLSGWNQGQGDVYCMHSYAGGPQVTAPIPTHCPEVGAIVPFGK